MELVVNELFESSSCSSSSDEELFFLFNKNENEKNRVHNFVDVIQEYSDMEFREHFRLRRESADILIDQFKRSEFFRRKLGGGGRSEIPANLQIYVFLWFAGNKDSYREVANIFNISLASAHRILSNILEFIFKESPKYIKFPQTEEEKLRVSRGFQQIVGFKNVVGCIDGCYIPILKMANKIRSTYINRHDQLSLTLQGICDSDKKFVDVCIGSPSRIHDARIFKLSDISKNLPVYCGAEYHLLGDAAYPLREYLLTPYKDYGHITELKKKYNKKLSQPRVKIENSFSLLKIRFRQLIRLDFFPVERMSKFVLACCVLHNLCIDQGDLWTQAENVALANTSSSNDDATNTYDDHSQRDTVLQRLVEIKRSRIAESF